MNDWPVWEDLRQAGVSGFPEGCSRWADLMEIWGEGTMMCELSQHCHIYDNHSHYMGLQCNYFHLTIRNPIIGLLPRILASKFKGISFLKAMLILYLYVSIWKVNHSDISLLWRVTISLYRWKGKCWFLSNTNRKDNYRTLAITNNEVFRGI